MTARVKMQTIADEAGVSVATVSRVLKNLPGASRETRTRILSIRNRLHYLPSVSAQELAYRRNGRNRGLGIVRVFTRHMRDYGRGFYVDLNNGLHLLSEFGCEVIQTQFSRDDLESVPESMLRDSLRVDGAVFVGTAPRNAVEHYLRQEIPVVLADLESDCERVACVVSDSTVGLRQLMEYLIGGGHRRIAYVCGSLPSYATRERFDTYRCMLLDAGCEYSPERVFQLRCTVVGADADWRGRFGGMRTFDFSAVVCENDVLALGVMNACLKSGVRIPEDLSIAGIDDTNAVSYAPVPLTTVHIPAFEMGESVARLLCSQMRCMPIPQGRFSVSSWLVERESCRKIGNFPDESRNCFTIQSKQGEKK